MKSDIRQKFNSIVGNWKMRIMASDTRQLAEAIVDGSPPKFLPQLGGF
jgi:hypothetical protein